MGSTALRKRLLLKSLAVISAVIFFGAAATALFAGSVGARSDSRPQGAASKHATFSMY